MDLTQFLHYFSISLCTFIPSLGVSIGQAIATKASFKAIDIQPAAENSISKTTIIALAFIESAGLFGVLCSLLLFFHKTISLPDALGQLGVVLSICITGFITSLISSLPISETFISIARQPFSAQRITNLMILCVSLVQTPLAFGFIITLLINYQLNFVNSISYALGLIATGLCIGLASIGPAVGGGLFTRSACKSVGLNEKIYGRVISYTIISQAIIETPVIFGVIVSLWILTSAPSISEANAPLLLVIGGLMGIGTLGAGIGSGRTAAGGCGELAFLDDQYYNILSKTTIIAQGLIDTSAIYALLVSIILILGIY